MMRSVLAALLVAGCATPYQPLGFKGGYSEMGAGENTWLVSFRGNGFTSAARAREGAFRRATELCGGRSFDLLNSAVDSQTQQFGGYQTDCTSSGRHTDCSTTGPTVITKHDAQILVRCHHGGAKTAAPARAPSPEGSMSVSAKDWDYCNAAVAASKYPSLEMCGFALKHPTGWKCVQMATTASAVDECIANAEHPSSDPSPANYCERAVKAQLYPSMEYCDFALKNPEAHKCVVDAKDKVAAQKCVDDAERASH